MPDRIRNSRNVGISTISEMNDFVNSFNKIVIRESNYSNIDKIFAELFKKANYFDFGIDNLKEVENLMRLC